MVDKEYSVNEIFVPEDCSGECTCQAGGAIKCVPLCPPSQVRCSRGYKVEFYNDPVSGSSCSCKRSRCVLGMF